MMNNLKSNILSLLEKLADARIDKNSSVEAEIRSELQEQYKQVKSLVVVKMDAIGDSLLFANSLKALRSLFPAANITIIGYFETREILERCPYADTRIYVDRNLLWNDKQYRERTFGQLNALTFDLLINPLYSREYYAEQIAVFVNAGIKIGVTGDLSNIPPEVTNLTDKWYDYLIKPDVSKTKFELERNAEIISLLGGEQDGNLLPELWEDEQDNQFIINFLADNKFGNYAVVFPGTKGGKKSIKYWEAEKYAALVDYIQGTLKLKAVLLGSADDVEICNEIASVSKTKPLIIAGYFSIWQSAAFIKHSKFYVGSDTSMAHFSAVQKVPTVVIMGGGHFGRFLPYPEYTYLVTLPLSCYGCNWKCNSKRVYCIQDIDAGLVISAIEDILNNRAAISRIYVNGLSGKESMERLKNRLSKFIDTNKVDIVDVKKNGILSYSKKIVSLAEEAIQAQNFSDAKKLAESVLQIEPSDVDALNNTAVIETVQKHWAAALVKLRKVIEAEPNNSVALNNIRYINEAISQGQNKNKSVSIKISVITPSYNQGDYIEETIQSVLYQNYTNFEHIIIDGGSTDGTVEILKKYPHLKWVSEKDNGQSDALNKGFGLATGDIIAWINSDDWYEPDTFNTVARFFEENEYKNVVMGNCNLVEDGVLTDCVINTERGFEELKNYKVSRAIPTQPAIFFRKKLFADSGLLNINLKYVMDYDLWMRFAKKNKFFHINQTFANYRFHKEAKIGDSNWGKIYPECEIVKKRYDSDPANPLVSVIIPCYNYAKYLPDAVESVIKQTYTNWEIIIINDGSPDNTIEVAERLIAANLSRKIKLINQENSGKPAISRNRGIAESNGEFILPLDADDVLAPDAIRMYVSALNNMKKDNAVVFGSLKSFGATSNLWQTRIFNNDELLRTTMIPYCCMFHRYVWQNLNGYSTKLGYEDWDFWIGAAENGAAFINVPAITTLRRETESTSRQVYDRKRHEWNIAGIISNHKNLYEDYETGWAEEYLMSYSDSSSEEAHNIAKEKYPAGAAIAMHHYPGLYEQEEIKWAENYLLKNPFTIKKGFNNSKINGADQSWIMNKVNEGIYNLKNNMNIEAIKSFDEVLKVLPGLTEVKYGRAVALANSGQVKAAKSELDELLKMKPDYTAAREFKAKLG